MRPTTKWLGLTGVAVLAAFTALVVTRTADAATESLLSQAKPATSSSVESTSLGPAKAFDGNTATRWASAEGVDPQWIQVDLGSTATDHPRDTELGGRLRQGVHDPDVAERVDVDHDLLHHRRQRRHRRPDRAHRHRPLRAAVRHRPGHPVRLLAVGVQGLRRRRHAPRPPSAPAPPQRTPSASRPSQPRRARRPDRPAQEGHRHAAGVQRGELLAGLEGAVQVHRGHRRRARLHGRDHRLLLRHRRHARAGAGLHHHQARQRARQVPAGAAQRQRHRLARRPRPELHRGLADRRRRPGFPGGPGRASGTGSTSTRPSSRPRPTACGRWASSPTTTPSSCTGRATTRSASAASARPR